MTTGQLDAAHRSRLTLTGAVPLHAAAAADLDVLSIFTRIDRTSSTLGRQALYHRLHAPRTIDELTAFERLVSHFESDRHAAERARAAVSPLQDAHGYNVWWLGQAGAIDVRPWHRLFPLLALLALALGLITLWWHAAWPLFVAMIGVVTATRLAVSNEIHAVSVALRQVPSLVAAGARLTFLESLDVGPLGALGRDVRSLARLRVIARVMSGDPLMLSSRTGGLAMIASALVTAVYEYLNIVLLLDANGVYFASSDLKTHAPALIRVVTAIGEIDTALSVATWRAEQREWTRPTFLPPTAPSRFAGLRHPLVDDAVPNSLNTAPGTGVLVLGSNMSGKSTFIRTVGVNALLAQTVHTCLATTWEAPYFVIRSCIARGDDIRAAKSYYLAEVEAVLAMLDAASGAAPHLLLFDELFRGTNTVERIAAAHAVLAGLVERDAGSPAHVVLVTTHDDELVEVLGERYTAYHFAERVDRSGLVFDYVLRRGTSTTRTAIALLEYCGAPAAVVKRARATVARLDARR